MPLTRHTSRPFAALPVALATLLAVAGCSRHEAPPAPAAQSLPTARVRTQAVAVRRIVATEDVVGTVRARLRASLEAKIAGRIESLTVAPGQSVKAGDILARLDVREVNARLEQAFAARDQAERDLKRFAALVQQGAVTRQEFDAADSRVRATRAAVTEAETMLGYAQVTAPFNGVITRKLADVGDLAVPGKALLELEDPTSLRLEADVPEGLIAHVTTGASMPVRIPALNRELTGTVTEVAPAADSGSRTFLVKFDLPAAPDLRAGLFGRVAVPAGEREALRVPASAVVIRGQLELVFAIVEKHAQLRLVRAGRQSGGEIELLSGLRAGETLVVEGAADLRDGQPVEVQP